MRLAALLLFFFIGSAQAQLLPGICCRTIGVSPPVVANVIPDMVALANNSFASGNTFAANTCTDPQSLPLTYTVAAGLPSWASFNSGTRTFTGNPATGDVGSNALTVNCSNGTNSANTTLNIYVPLNDKTAVRSTQSSPSGCTLTAPADPYIAGDMAGGAWGATVTQPPVITYSYPSSGPQYTPPYNNTIPPLDGYIVAPANQQTNTDEALAVLQKVLPLTFFKITETAANHGMIRSAASSTISATGNISTPPIPKTTGTCSPQQSSVNNDAGDTFMNSADPVSATPGTRIYIEAWHELGHDMGLKHGQEQGAPTNSYPVMPADKNGLLYTILTYCGNINTASPDTNCDKNHFWLGWSGNLYPQNWGIYDLQALQNMYGVRTCSDTTLWSWSKTTGQRTITTNGNAVVRTAPGSNIILESLWKCGGTSTLSLGNYTTDITADISPGGQTNLGTQNSTPSFGTMPNFLMQLNTDTPHLWDNITTGSGNDSITGNAGNNTIDGGTGTNTMNFAGALASYVISGPAGGYCQIVSSAEGTDLVKNIQIAVFTDITVGINATPCTFTAFLNPSDKSASVTLSNNNLTASVVSGTDSAVRTTRTITQKTYYEDSFPGTGQAIGAGNSSAQLNGFFVGGDANAIGIQSNGNVYINAGVVGSITPGITSDKLGVAIDPIAHLFWVRLNGGNWNGSPTANPATGVGGIDISSIPGPLFGMVSSTNSSLTANFGASAYAFTPPAGFGNL